MANVLIFGAGGVGCTYGYFLFRGGCKVTAVCRTNYEVVKEKGIVIKSKVLGKCHYHPTAVKTVAEAAEHGPFDYIIVASKAFHDTAELIKDAVTPHHTAIALAQNGIGIEEDYARLYPNNTIISGVVYLPVTQVESGVIEHGLFERFEIGTYPASADTKAKEQTKRLSELWSAGGANAPVFDDVQRTRWFKLAINAAWNPTTALTLCDDANYLRSSPGAEELIKTLMREVGRIATADGYCDVITEELIEKDLQRPRSRLESGGKEPSMLVDARHSRRMEVEAIVGNALKIGHKHGVETPCLQMLYTLATGRNYSIRPDEHWKPIARND